MMKKKYYFYLVIVFITIFVAAIFTVYERNMTDTAAQIGSNSTFTTCINSKCVTTMTICIINQPCHTVRSNSTNADNNNSTDDNNNIITTPFSQGTI
jgi:CDP-diacylglycerol pyrophosphatase